ncbi:hypothetical protein [Nocardia alni]|uniref:hypothetical protein n=1 Tax=Nocardia alni TaxID=2815723 RepID=UPI001C2480A7|nr:hypothetical protein [Nocardia alni]
MAVFRINEGYNTEQKVTATDFTEVDSLVIFHDSYGNKVFAIPTDKLSTIERLEDEKAVAS